MLHLAALLDLLPLFPVCHRCWVILMSFQDSSGGTATQGPGFFSSMITSNFQQWNGMEGDGMGSDGMRWEGMGWEGDGMVLGRDGDWVRWGWDGMGMGWNGDGMRRDGDGMGMGWQPVHLCTFLYNQA